MSAEPGEFARGEPARGNPSGGRAVLAEGERVGARGARARARGAGAGRTSARMTAVSIGCMMKSSPLRRFCPEWAVAATASARWISSSCSRR